MIRISVGRTYWWKGSLWNVVERFSSGFASPELVVVQRLATGEQQTVRASQFREQAQSTSK